MIVDDEHANARFARVSVQGEHSDDWLYGVNAYNGIYFESFLGTSTVPLSGSFKVRDSHFTTVASGTSVAVVVDTHISILNNVYTDVVDAFDAADLRGSTAEFIGNTIAGATLAGVYLYDTGTFPDGSSNSHLVIAQNKFSGAAGLFLDLTMTDVGCVLVMNDTKAVTGDGTYLGARTNNCIVISRDPRVVDLGTNNRIITTDH